MFFLFNKFIFLINNNLPLFQLSCSAIITENSLVQLQPFLLEKKGFHVILIGRNYFYFIYDYLLIDEIIIFKIELDTKCGKLF